MSNILSVILVKLLSRVIPALLIRTSTYPNLLIVYLIIFLAPVTILSWFAKAYPPLFFIKATTSSAKNDLPPCLFL